MNKKLNIIYAIFVLFLVGCMNESSQGIKYFNSKQDAINYGIEEEGIEEEDILEVIQVGKSDLYVFKFKMDEGEGINIAYVIESDGKYAWYLEMSRFILLNPESEFRNTSVMTETKSLDGTITELYMGTTSEKDFQLKLKNGLKVTPTIVKGTNMYYHLNK